jgi:HlyD family secretion protein
VATRKDGAVLRQINTLFTIGATRELTDGQLLEHFSTGEGEAAQLAFEALVERHGAMVLRVCRAHLVDPHATQDAFQATFLILVKVPKK